MPKTASQAELTVREVRVEDAEAVAQLTGELGYPAAPEMMADRIRTQMAQPGYTVLVACQGAKVVGWIDVRISHHLQSGAAAEIGGLVVSAEVRSLGIGGALLARAEAWAQEQGIARMLVRSQIARERAHRFYLERGYQRTKTSAVFSKQIAG